MVSEPRKIVLTSLFVGALAIAAYVSQSGKSGLPADELGLEHDNASAHYTRGNTITGSVSSGPVVASSESAAAIAGNLRAARRSLQRNDLAAAQAQLDAIRPAHPDDEQVLALQKEVEARTEQAQHAPAAMHAEKLVQQGGKSARLASPSSSKTGRLHANHVAIREHSNRYAKTSRAPETAVSAASVPGGRANGVGAPAVASSSVAVPAEAKVISNVTSVSAVIQPIQPIQQAPVAPPGPQAQPNPQAAPAQSTPWPPQFAPAIETPLRSESGPKTRAQVRAEIARARADGSLPAFGNPDPAGPGGAPSLTNAPRP
ncbi:DUF4148 domain-containing protein [Paraburkholderia haematera]|uniref:DUF4148 domain-containing protein n=1 Tax=Paraburkholderia haematera TaxID=2793077 RepID=A0ABM8QY59_9BURK|nr:DUF4148 domain-containing protein [Paraburkholderia haematera]CAE6722692.1 hypothetical protein R69888_01684 [Paraburkholderia haematera]